MANKINAHITITLSIIMIGVNISSKPVVARYRFIFADCILLSDWSHTGA